MFSDAPALSLTLFAIWIAEKPAATLRTYGYYRAEILAALVNGATPVAVSGYIFLEDYQRISAPPKLKVH